MELTTERCTIRNMKMEDTNDLHQVLSDASVMMYIEQVFDIEKTRCFIQSAGLCDCVENDRRSNWTRDFSFL